jgi:hypothetical protein
MPIERDRRLTVLLIGYAVASLLHFVHNAEFLAEYPNLPASWTRTGVYLAWVGLSAVGLAGWLMVSRGYQRVGLALLCAYALLGIDSLGHYAVAPFSAHTSAMNATIIMEVGLAMGVFVEAMRRIVRRNFRASATGA